MDVNRIDPPGVADERTMLESWLDYHRATLAMKCDGLEDPQLRERAVPPSTLSLLGLVRHMAEVERAWFRRFLGGEDAPYLYCARTADGDRDDGEFDDVETAEVAEDFATWHEECEHSRGVAASLPSLDVTAERRGEVLSFRWVLVHMVEEYARHNGHADLIRQSIDGAVGD
ncbi:MAG TPA: DinB family protein [Acidimicrobiales bacterium]|nr:DinB family protein [Acidimicrobiales bacterium]